MLPIDAGSVPLNWLLPRRRNTFGIVVILLMLAGMVPVRSERARREDVRRKGERSRWARRHAPDSIFVPRLRLMREAMFPMLDGTVPVS